MILWQRIRGRLLHYRWVGECLLELLRAQWAVRHRPFAETAATLQQPLSAMCPPAERDETLSQVRWAMGSIHRRISWRPACLVRAIAAQRVLARHRVASSLVLSVTPASGAVVDAHAWLEAGDVVVTGRTEKSKYVPIYTLSNAGPGPDGKRIVAQRGGNPVCVDR